MRARRWIAVAIAAVLLGAPAATAAVTDPTSTIDGARSEHGARRISYVATLQDRPDLRRAGLGRHGHWFANFGAAEAVTGAATSAGARDALPDWVAAFNHTEHPADPGCTGPGALQRGCLPTYAFRTFSQDGPARSAGGHAHWAALRLPDGSCGTAGAVVDPHTFVAGQDAPDPTGIAFPPQGQPAPNNNNTINRVQLQDGTPATFYVGVVTDTTGGDHDPGRVEIRGNVGLVDQNGEVADSQIEPDTGPDSGALISNGIPDVHVFRIDGFVTGDYLKLRLRGRTAPASFAGLLFDDVLRPGPPAHAAEPASANQIRCR